MRIGHERHLTYCLNVHPGETWAEQEQAVREHAVAVKALVSPAAPFGLGLRISARAAAELAAEPARISDFRNMLESHNLYAFTVNAFPFGRFHGAPVKDEVYRPDWSDPERRVYTQRVAEALSALAPADAGGSISTAPLTFKGWPGWEARVGAALEQLARCAGGLARLEEAGGRRIVLAMEPEPMCYPETVPELVEVMRRLRTEGARLLAKEAGVPEETAREWLVRHVGCCFDAAHQAVEFEEAEAGLALLAAEGIAVAKAQLSAALELDVGDRKAFAELSRFQDKIYLHQAVFRGADGALTRWVDLPALLADAPGLPDGTVRVHYHVPLFVETCGALRSTTGYLKAALPALVRATRHLEVETYTWTVWNEAAGGTIPLDRGIAEELTWVLERLGEGTART
jgi:hypothetical protein